HRTASGTEERRQRRSSKRPESGGTKAAEVIEAPRERRNEGSGSHRSAPKAVARALWRFRRARRMVEQDLRSTCTSGALSPVAGRHRAAARSTIAECARAASVAERLFDR